MITYLFQNDKYAIETGLAAMLMAESSEVERLALPNHHEEVIGLFSDKPGGIVILPAIWEDLFSAKVIGELASLDTPYETILAGPIPDPSLLIVAFNEGLAAYLETPSDPDRIRRALNRARARYAVRSAQTLALRRLDEYEAGTPPLLLTPELIARDHFLGQAFIRCMENGGMLFEGRVSVLLVSSSKSQQRQIQSVLSKAGFQVDHAESMATALEAIGRNKYAVVISDRLLPDGDALVLASRMHKRALPRMPRIVVWSASPEKAHELMQPGSHIDHVLLKPTPDTGIESVLPTIIAAAYQASH